MHKSLVILAAFFLFNISLSLLYSCNKGGYDDDRCGPFKSEYCAKLTGIKVDPKKGYNNSYDSLDSNASIRYYEFVLSVTLQGEEIICKSSSNPFMASAIACSPPIPRLNFKGTITNVSITCDQDYDDTHPIGADLSTYFEIVEGRNDLNKMEYTGNGGITGNQKFQLTSSPKTNNTYTFTVTYHMSDGTQLQAECMPIILTH